MIIYVPLKKAKTDAERKFIRAEMAKLQREDRENTYITPALAFDYVSDKKQYELMCEDLLIMSDELRIVGKYAGPEIELAKKCKIPIKGV